MHCHTAMSAVTQVSGSLLRSTPTLLLLLLSLSQLLPLSTVAPVVATDGENIRPVCSGALRWAPLHIKQPYTSLLNSAYCPSWTTRHILSKLPQNTYLTLPKGVPFALLCGFCYNPNSLDSNATMGHQADGTDQPLAQVPIRDPTGLLEHSPRKMECLVQYALTGPLSGYSGRFTCQGSIGTRLLTEQATYTVYDVPITNTKETLDVPGRSVVLTCPSHPDPAPPSNPLVHVWYYPLATSPRLAAPTTNPTVTFRLGREPLVVSCATYHILSVTKVVVTTFTVQRSESYQLQGEAILGSRDAGGPAPSSEAAWDNNKKYGIYGQVPGDEEGALGEASTAGGGYQLPLVMVAVLSAAAAIIAVIAIIGFVKCLRRGGNRRR